MSRFQIGLLGLFFLALLAVALPGLGIFAAITLIGLPIAFVYWAIPAIFLVTALTYVYWRLLPLPRIVGIGAAVILCALTLSVPAYLLNLKLEADAKTYAADDHDDLQLPLSAKTIAVRSNRGPRFRRHTGCDGFCMHALLNGVAQTVVRIKVKEPFSDMDPEEIGVAYSLEKRAQCPAVKFRPGGHELKLPREKGSAKHPASAEQAMRLRMSDGDCLVQREASLKEADLVISNLRLLRSTPPLRARFSFSAQQVSAHRLAVHRRDPATQKFEETYRWTGVQYTPLAWALLPAPVFGNSYDSAFGWLRWNKRINITDKRYRYEPDWPGFLVKTLGLKLALNSTDTQERINKKLEMVLDAGRDPTPEEWEAFATYFKDQIHRRVLSKPDFALAIRVLENPKFPAPPRSHMITKYAQTSKDPDLLAKVTALFFDRLMSAPTWSEGLGVTRKRSLRNLAIGLRRLPDEVFAPYYQELTTLAADPEAREHAFVVLSKLSVFGDRATPTLVRLIDAGTTGGRYFFRSNEYQHPYMAGMRGLCLAGENAKSALPELDTRMSQGKLPAHASYGDLLVQTMVRLGADAERVWPVYSSGQQNPKRDRFDKQVRQASSEKPRC